MEEEHRFRKTRKAYLNFYLFCIFLVVAYIYIEIQGIHIETSVIIAGGLFIILGLKYTELNRLHNLYGYNSQFIFHKRGFFRRRIKRVFLARISDIIVTKGIINRILNFGDVKIHHFGGSGVMEIKKIDHPHDFIEGLQDMIHKSNPHPSHV